MGFKVKQIILLFGFCAIFTSSAHPVVYRKLLARTLAIQSPKTSSITKAEFGAPSTSVILPENVGMRVYRTRPLYPVVTVIETTTTTSTRYNYIKESSKVLGTVTPTTTSQVLHTSVTELPDETSHPDSYLNESLEIEPDYRNEDLTESLEVKLADNYSVVDRIDELNAILIHTNPPSETVHGRAILKRSETEILMDDMVTRMVAGEPYNVSFADKNLMRKVGIPCAVFDTELFHADVWIQNKNWMMLRNVAFHNFDLVNGYQGILANAIRKRDDRRLLLRVDHISTFFRTNTGAGKFYHFTETTLDEIRSIYFTFEKGPHHCVLGQEDIGQCAIPAPYQLPPLQHTSAGTSSGNITLLSSRRLQIDNFSFGGRGIQANFAMRLPPAAIERHGTDIVLIPDETGSLSSLRQYTGEKVVLNLPKDFQYDFYSMVMLMVHSSTANISFGHVQLPEGFHNSTFLPNHRFLTNIHYAYKVKPF